MKFEMVTAVLSAALGVGGAVLQDAEDQADKPAVRVQAGGVDVQADVDIRDREGARRSTTPLFKGSALVGMEVQNTAGDDLGEIKDLAVDFRTGKIVYAAVSFGGFAGVGDELFAVPWESFQTKKVGDREDDDWVAILNVSEERLEGAKGFNQDDWPETADERWRIENDRAFLSTERDGESTPRRQ